MFEKLEGINRENLLNEALLLQGRINSNLTILLNASLYYTLSTKTLKRPQTNPIGQRGILPSAPLKKVVVATGKEYEMAAAGRVAKGLEELENVCWKWRSEVEESGWELSGVESKAKVDVVVDKSLGKPATKDGVVVCTWTDDPVGSGRVVASNAIERLVVEEMETEEERESGVRVTEASVEEVRVV